MIDSDRPPAASPRPADGPAAVAAAVQMLRAKAADGPPPVPVRLRGRLQAGVEHGSLLLVSGQGEVLAQLVGGGTAAADVLLGAVGVGDVVVVAGAFRSDLVTTAQQGRPFLVQHAARES